MAEFIRMPQKGLTEESAILSKWYVKKGEAVKIGQLLFALETGKATFDVEAETAGTVLELRGSEGEEIAVKAVVCVIGKPGEVYSLSGAGGSSPVTAAVAVQAQASGATAGAAETVRARASERPEAGSLRVSPRARRLAEKNGLTLAGVAGTGPGGRIIEDDVKAALEKIPGQPFPAAATQAFAGMSSGDYTAVPNTTMRKTIAANMLRSLQTLAQLTMTSSFDASELLSYRERHNEARPETERLSINDLLVFAVSRVLLDFPYMNAHFSGEELRLFNHVHLGIAVDTPKGLLVPTVKGADLLSLAEISSAIKALAVRSKEGKIGPEELAGGTFTISNLGVYGIEFFTPVINPPQTAILGVGKIEYKRKKNAEEMIDYPAIGLSLTIDHRAVDGAPAARFFAALVAELETFSLLLAK